MARANVIGYEAFAPTSSRHPGRHGLSLDETSWLAQGPDGSAWGMRCVLELNVEMLDIEILGVTENEKVNGKGGGLNGGHEHKKELDLDVDWEMRQRSGDGSRGFEDAAVRQHSKDKFDSLPKGIEGLQLQDQHTIQSYHAPILSVSPNHQDAFPLQRLPYTRAPSSHVAESIAPSIQPIDAHAEAFRRLGKAERTVKTLKRRGSNESLSSLISYSIRRPSIPLPSRPGTYSLAALAHVLEEAAQEGNLPLVQAVMQLGANPNFRSVNRIKNRRHEALNLAAAAGHVDVVEFLMTQGATFHVSEGKGKDKFNPIDYVLLDVAYAGFIDVAYYLISAHNANPFVEHWPREFHDAQRTIYRRVTSMRVQQKTLFDALVKTATPVQTTQLLHLIMQDPRFTPTMIARRTYTDTPSTPASPRITQTTHSSSLLSTLISAGHASIVESLLATTTPSPDAYQRPDAVSTEQGQVPSACVERYTWPAHALARETWVCHPDAARRILSALVDGGFDIDAAQRTEGDSAPRTVLARCILADASAGVKLLLTARPALVEKEFAVRLLVRGGEMRECMVRPLVAALVRGSLECARVLLEYGADVRGPAFGYGSVVVFAAAQGMSGILGELVDRAQELGPEALEMAIQKSSPGAVEALLNISGTLDERIWDVVVGSRAEGKDGEYERIVELVGERMGKMEWKDEVGKKAI